MMTLEMLRQCTQMSDDLTGEIKGVVMVFNGLGATSGYPWGSDQLRWIKMGYLLVLPYYGPWSWMNRETRVLVDDIVEAVYHHFNLDFNKIPLISGGGSMGGYSALLYSRYAKYQVSGCAAFYPCTDLKYHFTEREDVAKTVIAAFYHYKQDFEEIFYEQSPICQIANMPKIPYLLLAGDADTAVSKTVHSDRMYKELKDNGFDVVYLELPGYGHGGELPAAANDRVEQFFKQFI